MQDEAMEELKPSGVIAASNVVKGDHEQDQHEQQDLRHQHDPEDQVDAAMDENTQLIKPEEKQE